MSTNKNFQPRSQTPTIIPNFKPQQGQIINQQFQNFSNSYQQKQIPIVFNYYQDQRSQQKPIQNIKQNIPNFQYQQGNQFQSSSQTKQPFKLNQSFQPNPQNEDLTQCKDSIEENQFQMKQEKQFYNNPLLRTSAIKSEDQQNKIIQDRPKSSSEHVQKDQLKYQQFICNQNHLLFQNQTYRNNKFQKNYNNHDPNQNMQKIEIQHKSNFQCQNNPQNGNQDFEQQDQQNKTFCQQQQNYQQQYQNNQITEQKKELEKTGVISGRNCTDLVCESNQHQDPINLIKTNDMQEKKKNYIQKNKKQVFETEEDVMKTLTRLKTMKFKCQHCQNETEEKLISLPCNHYYCQDCFKEYIKQQINQGYIKLFCHCKIKIKFTPILDAEIYSQYANQFFNNQLKQIQMKYGQKYHFQECLNCKFFQIQESLLQTNYIQFCNQQEKAAKYFCPEHQKPLQFIHMRESPKQKLLCKKCESTHKLKLNKASELLLEINQDHPLNYYLKETKKQYENLRKELKHKVDELLDETEDEINNLINHKLSDRLIQRYIFDEKLNEADFEKLHEIICKYYEYEKEGQQVIAKIPANEMGNVYSIQQKCQKIESIIKAFNKPKYYQKLNTQQSQENLGSMPIIIEPSNKMQEIKKKDENKKKDDNKKKDENKKKGLFSYNTEIIINSVCHCIQLNKTQNILICGLQENENEENLIVLQKQNEKYHQIQNLVGHIGSVYAIQLDADGDHLFSAGEDKTIRVWQQNVLSKQLNEKQFNSIQIIQNAHESEIHSLTLNKENNLLASGCKDGLIKIWVEIEKEWINSQTLQQHQNWVKSLSFNLETSLLASGSGDKTIIIWQLNDEWELFQIINDHTNFVNCVCFGSINNTFVSGSEDQTIKIWEQQKDKTFICIQQLEGGHYVRSVCFNFNQLLLITGSYSTIKVWTKNHSGKFVLNQEKFYDSRQVMISEDGKSIFSVNRFSFNIRVFKIKEKALQK